MKKKTKKTGGPRGPDPAVPLAFLMRRPFWVQRPKEVQRVRKKNLREGTAQTTVLISPTDSGKHYAAMHITRETRSSRTARFILVYGFLVVFCHGDVFENGFAGEPLAVQPWMRQLSLRRRPPVASSQQRARGIRGIRQAE